MQRYILSEAFLFQSSQTNVSPFQSNFDHGYDDGDDW